MSEFAQGGTAASAVFLEKTHSGNARATQNWVILTAGIHSSFGDSDFGFTTAGFRISNFPATFTLKTTTI